MVWAGKRHRENTEDIERTAVTKAAAETLSSSVSLTKMESATICGLLAANLLLLASLLDPTAACSCMSQTAKQAYCSTSYFLKAKVLSYTDNEETVERRYRIKTTKVLKGPETLKDIPDLYTRLGSNVCGYEHPMPFNQDEYVFAVSEYGGRMRTSLCAFINRWKDLSRSERKGFRGRYKNKCN